MPPSSFINEFSSLVMSLTRGSLYFTPFLGLWPQLQYSSSFPGPTLQCWGCPVFSWAWCSCFCPFFPPPPKPSASAFSHQTPRWKSLINHLSQSGANIQLLISSTFLVGNVQVLGILFDTFVTSVTHFLEISPENFKQREGDSLADSKRSHWIKQLLG